MKKEFWLPSVVFLAGSIPMVYFLQYTGWGGDYVLLIAMAAGALASAFVMPKKTSSQPASNIDNTANTGNAPQRSSKHTSNLNIKEKK